MNKSEYTRSMPGKFFNWLIGGLFLIISTAVFAVSGTGAGLLVLVSALLLIPPIQDFFIRKFSIKKVALLNTVLVIAALSASLSIDPYADSRKSDESYHQLTQSVQERSPIAQKYVSDSSFITQQSGAEQVYVYLSSKDKNNFIDSVPIGTKVDVYEVDDSSRRSLIAYNFSRKNILTNEEEKVNGAAWIDTDKIFDEATFKVIQNPGIEVTRQWVTKNSIGVPIVNLNITNSTGKDIDGVKVKVVGVNNFGEFINESISGSDEFRGYSQETIKNDSTATLSWTMNLFDSITATSSTIYELHFTDGSKWAGNVTNTMDELLNRISR